MVGLVMSANSSNKVLVDEYYVPQTCPAVERRKYGFLHHAPILFTYVVLETAIIQWERAFRPRSQHNCKDHIISGSGSGLESPALASDKGNGLGFGLTNLLRGQSTTGAAMQHFVGLCCRQNKPSNQ